MSWLDSLFAGVKSIAIAGRLMPAERTLNFASGATAADNPSSGSTDITFTGTGSVQYMTPLNGVSDDWPRLMTGLAAGPVVMLPGPQGQHWQAKSAQTWPSNSTCYMTAATIIDNGLPGTGSVLTAPIASGYSEVDSGLHVVTPAVFGQKTFVASGSIPVNKPFLMANSGLQGSIYFCKSSVSAGGGNFTITVDRPILFNILTSQEIQYFINDFFPRNIRIFGNGAQILGGGGVRSIEMLGAWDTLIENLIIDRQGGGSGDFDCSLDVGNYRSRLRGITLLNSIGLAGQVIESGESSSIESGYVAALAHSGGNGVAYILMDCSVCETSSTCVADACDSGLQMSSDGGVGCYACTLRGSAIGSTSVTVAAVTVTQSSSFCALADIQALNGAGIGIHSVNDTGGTFNIRMANVHAHGNVVGVLLEATVFHEIQGIDVTGNVQNGLQIAPSSFAAVDGLISYDGNDSNAFIDGFGATVFCDNSGTLLLTNSFIRNTTGPGAGWSGVRSGRLAGGSLADVTCVNVRIYSTSANTFGFDARGTGGWLNLTNCYASGSGTSTGLFGGGSTNVYLGIGNNFDACHTPINIGGGFNEVTFTAPGPTTFNFPVRNGVAFESWITTRGGTPQPLTIDNIVVGTSFRVTGGGADTSTWKIKAL